VITGLTTNPDYTSDDVVVVNGQVVLSEGDPVPVDMDNDGVLDTAYVGRGNGISEAFIRNTNGFVGLAPDRTVYILATLRTGPGLSSDSPPPPRPASAPPPPRTPPAAPPACCLSDYNGDGDVGTDADIEAFFRVLAGGSC